MVRPGLLISIHLNRPQSLLSKRFFFFFLVLQSISSLEANHQSWATDHIRILGIGLELACNGGSCGGISLKND